MHQVRVLVSCIQPGLVICFTLDNIHVLMSPLDCKAIKPVLPEGNQSWMFIERTDAEAEAVILWLPDVKNWLIGKDPDAGQDSRQEEKGMTEYQMVAWHHELIGHEFEQAPGVADGQESLSCCSPWGHKESDMIEWLKWAVLIYMQIFNLYVNFQFICVFSTSMYMFSCVECWCRVFQYSSVLFNVCQIQVCFS